MALKFTFPDFSALRMRSVVVLNLRVAVEAQGDAVVGRIVTVTCFWLDVMKLYFGSTKFVAKATASATRDQSFFGHFLREPHND